MSNDGDLGKAQSFTRKLGKDIFDFPTSYRRDFEAIVVSQIEFSRGQMDMAAILVPVTLPLILEYTDFIESEGAQLGMISFVVVVIILSTLFFILSDKLTINYFSNMIDAGFKKELDKFLQELVITNHALIKKHPKNFLMKSIDEIDNAIRSHSGSQKDNYSYEDELHALDALDNLASKLRTGLFTLSDLQVFCKIENLIVIEDYSILDRLLELEKEINSPRSKLLARFYHDNNLGFLEFDYLKKIAKDFVSFVITGKGSDDEEDKILNAAVRQWIENTRNVQWTPYVIYTNRMSAYIFYEFSRKGTAYAAALMEELSSDEMERKIEFYTSEDGAPLRAYGHASQVGGSQVDISFQDERFDIQDFATPPTEVWENMTIQMGFGSNYNCNVKVGIDSSGRGAVVIREYFVLPTGYSKWAFFGEGGKKAAKQESLLALVKSSASLKAAKIADLSSSYIFAQLFQMSTYSDESDLASENDLATMKKVMLQATYT
mmetsp:Transcript_1478/g.2010  ORF Transcript_1478/g.2010 Transcript_1478/m.2010 type:complete len:491 (+) Transcript_1478:120-1592(+)